MSGERLFWVTPGDGGAPYRVALRSVRGGWEAEVEREGERWSFPIAAGERPGLAWSGTRPVRYRRDAGIGGLSLDGRLVLRVRVHGGRRQGQRERLSEWLG